MKFEYVRVLGVPSDLLRRYRELAEMTGKVDFGCDACAAEPPRCCGGCLEMVGYLNWMNKDDLKMYRSLFVKRPDKFKRRMGFWTEDGCALPRRYRSMLCLTHRCYHSPDDKLVPWEEKICDELIALNIIIAGGTA